MKLIGKRRGVLALTAALALASFSAMAWACTVQPATLTIFPQAGLAGSRLTVQTAEFGPGPVEVRWNSVKGPVIGQGEADNVGGEFAVEATVPAAKAGVHYLMVIQRNEKGSVTYKSVDTFEVTGSSASARPAAEAASLWNGFSEAPAGDLSAPVQPQTGNLPGQPLGWALAGVGALGTLALTVAAGVRARKRTASSS